MEDDDCDDWESISDDDSPDLIKKKQAHNSILMDIHYSKYPALQRQRKWGRSTLMEIKRGETDASWIYQMKEEEKEEEILKPDEECIEVVMEETGCTYDKAKEVLLNNRNDIIHSIEYLS